MTYLKEVIPENDTAISDERRGLALDWLHARGVAIVVVFPVHSEGNSLYSERWAELGHAVYIVPSVSQAPAT
jgi:hypothetical protein